MTGLLSYFAYGSNLHVARLQRRVSTAQVFGKGSIRGYRLCFHKSSKDGSAKCNALYTGDEKDVLLGVVYNMKQHQKRLLDAAEGLGFGYFQTSLMTLVDGQAHRTFLYVSHPAYIDSQKLPFYWYRELVLQGAKYHDFDTSYVDSIALVNCTDDPNQRREKRMFRLAKTRC